MINFDTMKVPLGVVELLSTKANTSDNIEIWTGEKELHCKRKKSFSNINIKITKQYDCSTG